MKELGSVTKQMATASSNRQMVMFTKACGSMIKHTGRANLSEKMEAPTRDIGPMISSMVKGLRRGLMAASSKESITKVCEKALEP